MVRLASKYGMTVKRALTRFKEARPGGIYKDAYISDLFRCVRISGAFSVFTFVSHLPQQQQNQQSQQNFGHR